MRLEKADLCESTIELRVVDWILRSCCASDRIDSSSFTIELGVEEGEFLKVCDNMMYKSKV